MIFSEVNPIPVKMGASILGFCEPTMRLPLTTMTDDNAEKLSTVLKNLE
jgi:4-hydroxy-tetrahydrodipicolinate synthase